ncbi:hypothetical protein ASPWEDRAFT_51058 [Aspergillus wentii DTO 134E9]|uniref:C2H2 type master regulator of conidiophore development brlA n=1 Tax=Aspergillus wentii DTO 134E9 TaxID=1073089 RepID=A0A1L9RIN1_ASPWE|nr:uncharacterized protein ASPWEDRAFT_51058 [Aspergillus wentii DTO 134E9]OJJ34786.1 hypothetical protein ASPWEDRAFT_51058 [Aspergillus wentii DTO 134E9]
MRSHANLTVEVDSVGSSECPSMASSGFSPLDSPTPTPTSLYSQGSLASPGWPDGSHFQSHVYDRPTGSTPLHSAFRLSEVTSNDGMGMSCGNMDAQERMPMTDYLSGYDESVFIPSDLPKTYDGTQHGLSYQTMMPQYPLMARNPYRHQQAPYLADPVTNPSLTRPIFGQPERMTNTMPMGGTLQWIPPAEPIQTIQPSQAFQTPMTPPPSYSDFSTSISTPNRSCSLGTPSGTETPMSRLSGGAGDYEEYPMSPVYRDAYAGPQRHQSRKPSRKPSRQDILEHLPPVIRTVQFKCKEPGCKGRFKRQEHLKRHMKSHSKEKPHRCWVPGCGRAFSRSDNLNAHYTKTHSKRGGRNRYVATLDENSIDFDPEFRGQLTPDGRPIRGSQLEAPTYASREPSYDEDWN